jgi:hypothetical protein
MLVIVIVLNDFYLFDLFSFEMEKINGVEV